MFSLISHSDGKNVHWCALLLLSMLSVSANASIEFGIDITHDSSHVVSGGLERGTRSRTLASAFASYQVNENWSVYGDFWALRGGNGSQLVGDIQAFSNIDEDEFSRVYEAWVEASFTEFRIKSGFIDANTEFAAVEHGGEFINSSLGFTPTIGYMPSYPEPALALNTFVNTGFGEISVGVFSDDDHDFDETFTIAQFKTQILGGIAQLGIWHQTGMIQQLDGTEQSGDKGYYFTFESTIPAQYFSSESMAWILKFSAATENSLEIQQHAVAGIVFYAPFGLVLNQMGFTLSHADIASDLRGQFPDSETAMEWFYLWQVSDKLSLKPDIQFIRSPAADVNADDAWVVTLRLQFSI